MNSFEQTGGSEAVLKYDDADFEILEPGDFVRCAMTGVKIPLQALRYWNVDKQEPYVDAAASMKGFGLTKG